MRVPRFSAGGDEQAQFSDLEIDYPTTYPAYGLLMSDGLVSPKVQVATVQVATVPAGFDHELAPAPQRQLVVILRGTLEIGTVDGAVRQFNPGDVFLADDADTPGHTTRVVIGAVDVLWVPVPDGSTWHTAQD